MEHVKYLSLLSLTLLLSSCAWIRPTTPPPEVIVKTVEVQVPIQHPTPPARIELQDVNWYVVSPKNLEEFLDRIEKEGNGVFFAMTVNDYENLSFNMQEIRRWINQTKEILIYYKNIDKKTEAETIKDTEESETK